MRHRFRSGSVSITSWMIIMGITTLRSEFCLPGVSSHHHPLRWADHLARFSGTEGFPGWPFHAQTRVVLGRPG